ncbi:MAG: putative membrane protein YphA (DoxX/SURF4 family) [Halieaceae bacterium]
MNEPINSPVTIAAGRILLGLCFVCDGILNLASNDVRIAYLDLAGAAHFWNYLAALVYVGGGLLLIANRAVIPAVVSLGGMLSLMTLILHSDYSPGTIGEFPPELRGEVNFKETAVHAAIIASLMLVAYPIIAAARGVGARLDITKRIFLLARVLLGLYFVTNGSWQWYYYDIRVDHIVATGGNPALLPVVIGLQMTFGACVMAGFKLRWFLPILMAIIVLSTIAIHGDLSPSAPYPPNVQIHQWFVKAAILAGLLLLFGLSQGTSRLVDARGAS